MQVIVHSRIIEEAEQADASLPQQLCCLKVEGKEAKRAIQLEAAARLSYSNQQTLGTAPV